MVWQGGYIAVDWGTTNRRAWRIGPDGCVSGKFEDDIGLLAVVDGKFAEAAATIRARLGDLPMLLAGMIGSNRGWREVPYISYPVDAAGLAAGTLWIEPGRTGIVPGVSQTEPQPADVMRGEEVQVLGAVAMGQAPDDGLICHPGTHAKWVWLKEGHITRFRTMMTGELFNLVSTHGILAPQLKSPVADDSGFAAGLASADRGDDAISGLFRIRAAYLLGESIGEPASYASGLLIGCDIRAALAQEAAPRRAVTLIGRPDLCALYAAALARRGIATQTVDGAEAFLAGIQLVAEKF